MKPRKKESAMNGEEMLKQWRQLPRPFQAFCIYLIEVLFFSCLYYGCYRYDDDMFVFNSDIRNPRFDAERAENERELSLLIRRQEALTQLVTKMGENPSPKFPGPAREITIPTDSYDATFTQNYTVVARTGGMSRVTTTVTIRDRSGEEVYRASVSNLIPGDVRTLDLGRALKDTADEIEQSENRKAELSGKKPQIWHWPDFLYFSVITQTTVGYGDILPAKTPIRWLVVLQIIVGVFILSVFLSMSPSASSVPNPSHATTVQGTTPPPL